MSRLLRRLGLIAAGVLALAPCADGQPGRSFVIKAGKLITCAPGQPLVVENGVLVVRDGAVVAAGRGVPVPADLPVIDLPDSTVMPGLVAAASASPVSKVPEESIGAAYKASDLFDRYGDERSTLASGVTTMHISPGYLRLVSGQGAVVRLGGPAGARVLSGSSDLTINLGEGAWNPPSIVEELVPPSSDNAIKPPRAQRPTSRMGQFLGLKEAIQAAIKPGPDTKFDVHREALGAAWKGNLPLRIQTQRAADISGVLAFLASEKRKGYIVGGAESASLAGALAESGVGLVYVVGTPLRSPGRNIGNDPAALDPDVRDTGSLENVRLALGVGADEPVSDLRLAAATARRGGLSDQRVIEGITRVPAELLGVGDRVGSLQAGRDADILVLNGDPLATSTHVERVYVAGRLAYQGKQANSLIVKAGTIWLGPNQWLENGSVLIENGKIVSVGKGVPVPPTARVIDAGRDGFVTPGFIDGYGHLGLDGDQGSTTLDTSLARLIGAPDAADLRVARAGVTTVMMAPYKPGAGGSRMAAVKTAGAGRTERVVSADAGVLFDLGDADPASVAERIKPRLDAGKKYLETWKAYEKQVADWEKQRAEGKVVEPPKPATTEAAPEKKVEDPLTGTWTARLSGGPIPAGGEREGKLAFKLTGTQFEARVIEPAVPVDIRVVGTLDGKHFTGHLEMETRGLGYPTFEGSIDEPDHAAGTVTFAGLTANFDMRRVDKGEVEFKVQAAHKKKTVGKDGRPLPPKTDETLEPVRALLEKNIPAVVYAQTPAQIDAALDVLVDQYDVPVVLLDAPGARAYAKRLAEKGVGVVLPPAVLRKEQTGWYEQGDDLSRKGIRVAFQSNGEDSARTLPMVGLFAVERGMSSESVLAAMTMDAARMYHLDSRIGSIAVGRDADLVIFSGPPFETGSAVKRVIVGGQEVPR
jgi:imidazolonepropionase-like amidohydrolase